MRSPILLLSLVLACPEKPPAPKTPATSPTQQIDEQPAPELNCGEDLLGEGCGDDELSICVDPPKTTD